MKVKQGCLVVRQLVGKVGKKGKKQLVTRMMPGICCVSCFNTIRATAEYGNLLPDWPSTVRKPYGRLLSVWGSQKALVEELSGKFLADYSKKLSTKGEGKDVSTVEQNAQGHHSVQLVKKGELKRCAVCEAVEELLEGLCVFCWLNLPVAY